jgi:hypothetical protein
VRTWGDAPLLVDFAVRWPIVSVPLVAKELDILQ